MEIEHELGNWVIKCGKIKYRLMKTRNGEPGKFQIMKVDTMSASLKVHPRASNVINIE